jgi:hypothetical protein
VAELEQFLEQDRGFLAIGRGERIKLERMLADGEIPIVRRAGDRPIDVGELSPAQRIP